MSYAALPSLASLSPERQVAEVDCSEEPAIGRGGSEVGERPDGIFIDANRVLPSGGEALRA
jgi:hypothetical protein